MPSAKSDGYVARRVHELLSELLSDNQADYHQLGRHIANRETDKALALLLEIADRNGIAAKASALLSAKQITQAEAYLLEEIRRHSKP